MILDVGAHCHRYKCLHLLFERGFLFLANTDLRALTPGRHEVDGDRMYLSIDHTHGRGRDAARLESHRRYIDVQYTMEGDEEIGWLPLAECGPPAADYNEAKDVAFYTAHPTSWLAVPAGSFVVFFPDDAHAPLAGRGAIKKAILKIAV
ncbi:MAG TPA: YhcH/YjgK/YiaL family protein [Vicinamibacterales bacterium]|nr:YhcH/YjgK/YiaL family protein [Vicinamibacterales bacterium]